MTPELVLFAFAILDFSIYSPFQFNCQSAVNDNDSGQTPFGLPFVYRVLSRIKIDKSGNNRILQIFLDDLNRCRLTGKGIDKGLGNRVGVGKGSRRTGGL